MRVGSRKTKSSRGVVLVELAVVIPLLVLILVVGVLELGRLFTQMSWLANVSYVSVLAGSESPPGAPGELAMHSKFDQLFNLQSQAILTHTSSPLYRQAEDMVEMDVQATVKTLTPIISLPVSMKLVGPMLALDPAAAGNLNEFKNPNCLYNCNGVVTSCCGSYSGCAALVCSLPPVIIVPQKSLLYPSIEFYVDPYEIAIDY
ncbi:MAG: pilus assembly protein [Deltaproteobacteria bacterium]|nr:pilus assembly protein [Deltaproteobacteria bacterium]